MKTLSLFTLVALLAAPVLAMAAGKAQRLTIPDFTKGDAIPAGAKHDWNLGPTGLRGWMFCDKMVTTDARQIAITRVEKGSPADGILAVGDVILGIGGKPFSFDPRTEFGKAVTSAESAAGGSKLAMTHWRAGKAEAALLWEALVEMEGQYGGHPTALMRRSSSDNAPSIWSKLAGSAKYISRIA